MFSSPPVLLFDYSTSLCDAQSWLTFRFFVDLSEGRPQLPQTTVWHLRCLCFWSRCPLITRYRQRQSIRCIRWGGSPKVVRPYWQPAFYLQHPCQSLPVSLCVQNFDNANRACPHASIATPCQTQTQSESRVIHKDFLNDGCFGLMVCDHILQPFKIKISLSGSPSVCWSG